MLKDRDVSEPHTVSDSESIVDSGYSIYLTPQGSSTTMHISESIAHSESSIYLTPQGSSTTVHIYDTIRPLRLSSLFDEPEIVSICAEYTIPYSIYLIFISS